MKNLPMLCVLLFFAACQTTPTPKDTLIQLGGKTMGTTYNISYVGKDIEGLKAGIDSLLIELNDQLSTYIPTSTISQFNNNTESKLSIESGEPRHFDIVFEKSKKVFSSTAGFFDPTVMPLVSYWGFGIVKRPVTKVDSSAIDSLKLLVGFTKVKSEKTESGITYTKEISGAQLDFSAVAKGYGVDAVCEYLEINNIHRYIVEIGGELRAKGKNAKDSWWTAGINVPHSNASLNEFVAAIAVKDRGMATSGDYRNFYEVDGKTYAHTIHPITGFPAGQSVLSATVIADDCATADAFATAFMAMGLEKSMEIAEKEPEIEAFFVHSDENGRFVELYTSGMQAFLVK